MISSNTRTAMSSTLLKDFCADGDIMVVYRNAMS
jgi:hypothetical protein